MTAIKHPLRISLAAAALGVAIVALSMPVRAVGIAILSINS